MQNSNKAIERVFDAAEKLVGIASKKLVASQEVLNHFKGNSEKSKALEKGKIKLDSDIRDLGELKIKILKSNNLLMIQSAKQQVLENGTINIFSQKNFADNEKKVIDFDELKEKLVDKIEETIAEISLVRLALNDNLFEKYINEFIQKFRIVTKFLGEEELGEHIKSELGENSDWKYGLLQNEMLKFFTNYKNGKANSYSSNEGNKLFKNMKKTKILNSP